MNHAFFALLTTKALHRLAAQIIMLVFLLLLSISFADALSPSLPAKNGSTPIIGRLATLTPTPSTTPKSSNPSRSDARIAVSQSIPGQPQVDANTVALYHFDAPDGNLAIDATGRYTGTLQGGAVITTSGLYGGVLVLDGQGSYVRIGNLGSLPQGTIEAYVDFTDVLLSNPSYFSSLIFAGSEFGGNTTVMNLGANTVFDIFSNGQDNYADTGVNPGRYLNGSPQDTNFSNWAGMPVRWPYETWRFHHIAATWGPRGIEIWLDGVLHAVGVYRDPNRPEGEYDCNPQRYVGPPGSQYYNPFYPDRCMKPVPALQMTPNPPPGDYFGPLPPYDTILIGCGSSGNCFKGRIDEVRISNVQRTFSYTLIPTVTPIPTQTPVPLTGEYQADSNTAALYHLDASSPCSYGSCVLDQVTNQAARSVGAIIPNGRFHGALAPDGNGIILVNIGDVNHSAHGTVEAWTKFNAGLVGAQPIINIARYSGDPWGAVNLGAFAPNKDIDFSVFDGSQFFTADSGVTPESLVGCWHHLAGTWGTRGVEVWVDGILRNANFAYSGSLTNQVYLGVAGADTLGNFLSGDLDEVRVSWVQRTFTPNSPSFHPVFSTNQSLPLPKGNAPSLSRSLNAFGTSIFLPFVGVYPTPIPPPCTYGS